MAVSICVAPTYDAPTVPILRTPERHDGLAVAPIVVAALYLAQDVLVAVAPIIGAPRVLSAATKITEALGIAIGRHKK